MIILDKGMLLLFRRVIIPCVGLGERSLLPICPFDISIQKPLPKNYLNLLVIFADRITARRLEQNLTKVDVAKIFNVSHNTVWELEDRGKAFFAQTMNNIIKWFGYVPPLDIDPDSLGR